MQHDPLTMFTHMDLSGQVRGNGFPTSQLPERLQNGIGWTPNNLMFTALGTIAAIAAAVAALGSPDIVVNNAGIATVSLLEDMPTAMWDEMIRVNLSRVFFCTRAVLPHLRARNYGRIINISSQLAHKGGEGTAHYAAVKAGILGLTRSLAYEVTRDNIAVNAICPGPLLTDMRLPPEWAAKKLDELVIGRQGGVEEVAPTALLLATEEAAFYVGATFNPNCGDIMV